jgi:hypothetical protein
MTRRIDPAGRNVAACGIPMQQALVEYRLRPDAPIAAGNADDSPDLLVER